MHPFNAWLKQPLSVNAWFSSHGVGPPLFLCCPPRELSCRTPWMWYLAFSGLLCGSVEAQSKLTYWLWFWHPWLPRTTWFAWDPPVSWAVSGMPTDTQGMQRYNSGVWRTERSNAKKKNPLFKLPDSSLVSSTLGTKTFPPNVLIVDGCCQSSCWHLHKIPNLIFL